MYYNVSAVVSGGVELSFCSYNCVGRPQGPESLPGWTDVYQVWHSIIYPVVWFRSPPRGPCSPFCTCGMIGFLTNCLQTGGPIRLNYTPVWIPLHLIRWMVFTFLSGKACTENFPSTEFSVAVNLTGPEYLWDLQSFDWNWLVRTVVIRQVLTHLHASKHREW